MTAAEFTQARERIGLSRRGLAAALGASRNTINRYEAGEQQIPKYIDYAIRWLESHKEETE